MGDVVRVQVRSCAKKGEKWLLALSPTILVDSKPTPPDARDTPAVGTVLPPKGKVIQMVSSTEQQEETQSEKRYPGYVVVQYPTSSEKLEYRLSYEQLL
eukprot:CAMPEP_0171316164 /NCGR_PEP_ID=MMETSP0816-20121228/70558_1 /TAXON_ID=420281 /ORGANISM="Proboscia inermis, Strain CCAP1064/1" /LENGTH=98 /DNA_ID=CAMNT_0011807759 /DNA_START=636 /DNA_END=928 /DNA_ORIENTATION=+